jgi:4-carboxymuconolactone decarboxylase
MPFHVNRAMDNGLTRVEAAEVIAHLAYYVGWPRAFSAVPVLEQVLASREDAADPAETGADAEEAPQLTVTPLAKAGAIPGPPEHFTGPVRIEPLLQAEPPARGGGAMVHFEPGARTAWHTHPLGQTLVITAGRGWVQAEGEEVQTVRPGDVVWIPPHLRHWHGASADQAMSHLAIAESTDEGVVTWMEQVSEEQYARGAATGRQCD